MLGGRMLGGRMLGGRVKVFRVPNSGDAYHQTLLMKSTEEVANEKPRYRY